MSIFKLGKSSKVFIGDKDISDQVVSVNASNIVNNITAQVPQSKTVSIAGWPGSAVPPAQSPMLKLGPNVMPVIAITTQADVGGPVKLNANVMPNPTPFRLPLNPNSIEVDTYVDQIETTTFTGGRSFVAGAMQGTVKVEYDARVLENHRAQTEELIAAYKALCDSLTVEGDKVFFSKLTTFTKFRSLFDKVHDTTPFPINGQKVEARGETLKDVIIDEIHNMPEPDPVPEKPKRVIKKRPVRGES